MDLKLIIEAGKISMILAVRRMILLYGGFENAGEKMLVEDREFACPVESQ